MSIDKNRSVAELADAYKRASRSWGRALEEGSPDAANTWFDDCVATYQELRRRGRGAVAELLPLLQSDEAIVVLGAASVLLEMFPAEAEAALREISAAQGLTGFTAKMTLREWEAGRMQLP